jgi:general stress protein YciG
MNYNKIHDAIIDRARERVSDSSLYHNHHIIPLHEDKNSIDTVPLTIKEHYVVHHLRWKMVGTPGNLYAYRLIKNGEQDLEVWVDFCRENVKKGALAWQEQSTPQQRSDAIRKGNATKGPERLSEAGKKAAATKGPEGRREASRKGKATLGPEGRSDAIRKGNATKGPERLSEAGKKGHVTRKANKQLREASLDI